MASIIDGIKDFYEPGDQRRQRGADVSGASGRIFFNRIGARVSDSSAFPEGCVKSKDPFMHLAGGH